MQKVDLSAYTNREQAFVKHCLIQGYLQDWCYTVGSKWDSVVFVDGFAGPWKTTKVIQKILDTTGPIGTGYPALFCEAMAFPLITPDELLAFVQSLQPAAVLKLSPDGRRKPRAGNNNDRVWLRDRDALARRLPQDSGAILRK
jgi:hypothetical protein